MAPQRSITPIIVSVVLVLLLLGSLVFGVWAFSERQSYKNDVDAKIEAAVAIAVQEAETAKEAEFVEREKSPLKNYTGPSTYGSISFDYPKTWSVYEQTAASGTVLQTLAHPNVIPGVQSEQPYALKIEVVSESYDSLVSQLQSDIGQGKLRSTAFRPEQVKEVLGIRVDGVFSNQRSGTAFYLPLRDRTIIITSEVPQNLADIENIILPSLTFVP